MVSYCDRWMSVVRRASSVVRRQQLLQRTSLTTGWILGILGRNDPYMALLKDCSKVPAHCISRSHRVKIDFQDENFKIFFSETTRPRA